MESIQNAPQQGNEQQKGENLNETQPNEAGKATGEQHSNGYGNTPNEDNKSQQADTDTTESEQ